MRGCAKVLIYWQEYKSEESQDVSVRILLSKASREGRPPKKTSPQNGNCCCYFQQLAAHFSCCSCRVLGQVTLVRIESSTTQQHYTVATSTSCKLFCPGETSVTDVEGKSGEISSFHSSPIEREWQTTLYLTFHWLHTSVGF